MPEDDSSGSCESESVCTHLYAKKHLGMDLSVGYLMSRVQCRGRRAKGIGVAAAVHLGLSDAFVFVMHEAVDVSCRVVSLTSLFARRTSYSSSRLISITASSGCEREHSTATLARRTL